MPKKYTLALFTPGIIMKHLEQYRVIDSLFFYCVKISDRKHHEEMFYV